MIDIPEALHTLRPGTEWVLINNELEWLDTTQTQPTEAEIEAEVTRLEAEYKTLEYSRLRKAEYDKLNQNELQADDAINGTSTFKEAILAIKAKYPKTV